MTKKRLFSVPYPFGAEPNNYLMMVEQYKEYIDSIFLEPIVPLVSHVHIPRASKTNDKFNAEGIICLNDIAKRFLRASLDKFKRVITINSGMHNMDDITMYQIVNEIIVPMIKYYHIEGVILTNYNMACYLHQVLPTVELSTSCNCYQWTIAQMKYWQENAGISVFNPPREILRTPHVLQKMHNAGFKIKAIVNENCAYGCPQMYNHSMTLSCNKHIDTDCLRGDLANIFRGNAILPRWLKYYDEFVDVYKIAGRGTNTEIIARYLDAYVNERDDVDLLDILSSGYILRLQQQGLSIPVSMVPDKVRTCMCENCNSCDVCNNAIKQIVPEYIKGIPLERKKYDVTVKE